MRPLPTSSSVSVRRAVARLRRGFDVAFSNAALHWAPDQPAVLRGVAASLRARRSHLLLDGRPRHRGGGLSRARRDEAARSAGVGSWRDAVSPHFFRGPEEYTGWLRDAGLEPRRVELVRKPMRHANARGARRLAAHHLGGVHRLRSRGSARRVPRASCSIACAPAATRGEGDEILMPMVNLEVEAVKPALSGADGVYSSAVGLEPRTPRRRAGRSAGAARRRARDRAGATSRRLHPRVARRPRSVSSAAAR